MADDEYEMCSPPLPADAVKQRRRKLEKAGYGESAAILLATNPDIDIDQALNLVNRGCPPETAVRILT